MTPEFRVWSKDLSKYRKLDDISNDQGLGMFFEVQKGIGSNVTSIYYSINDVVEQFTGLTDVNGNKIFEGDIVQILDDNHDGYIAPVKYMIADNYPAFDVDIRYVPISWYYEANILSTIVNEETQTMELIGNIHENLELLEGINNND